MSEEKIETDMVIIGAGIAGLSLAFRAGWHGLRTVVLDDTREGTTHAATGIVAPRLDYMLRDIDLVRISDHECRRNAAIFPNLITPKKFLIPIDPEKPDIFRYLGVLLKKYDAITPNRMICMPASERISRSQLATEEPNIRTGFDGAFILWELTGEPTQLLKELDKLNRGFFPFYRRLTVSSENPDFNIADNEIHEVKVETRDGRLAKIRDNKHRLVVVNAAGSGIKHLAEKFDIQLDINFRLGVQAKIEDYLFNSGIIIFDSSSHPLFLIQKGRYVQVGPTNTVFKGIVDKAVGIQEDVNRLFAALKLVIDPSRTLRGELKVMKTGLRVKPGFGDTNRPVIWSHRKVGLTNFYTLFPGKMSLGFLAADELLRVITRDGWQNLDLGTYPRYALEGDRIISSKFFLGLQKIKSLAEVGKAVLFK